MRVCGKCGGKKTLRCPTCGGSGKARDILGGTRKCNHCHGHGRIVCDHCGGRGQV
jgi:DnaJ-class molecular chaperone